jgi:hypothetical protein
LPRYICQILVFVIFYNVILPKFPWIWLNK